MESVVRNEKLERGRSITTNQIVFRKCGHWKKLRISLHSKALCNLIISIGALIVLIENVVSIDRSSGYKYNFLNNMQLSVKKTPGYKEKVGEIFHFI